jgi:hypothetical protein
MSRSTWILIVTLLAAPLLSTCAPGETHCAQCGRMECRTMAFTVHLKGGKQVETCCARCGIHYIQSEHPAVESLTARDFDGAGEIDAMRAFYVDGSDVTPCLVAGKPPLRDASGCCADPVYDRCLPSLIAFRSKEAAEAFTREHGGTVRGFLEIGGQRP